MNKDKLRKILNVIAPTDSATLEGFKAFDDGVAELKRKLQESITTATLNEVDGSIKKLKDSVDFAPIVKSIDLLKKNIDEKFSQVVDHLDIRVQELSKTIDTKGRVLDNKTQNVIASILSELDLLRSQASSEYIELSQRVDNTIEQIKKSNTETNSKLNRTLKTFEEDRAQDTKDMKSGFSNVDSTIEKTRRDLLTIINSKGGGNANRNITIGGNASTLAKYTDINLKAGSNVTITYFSNDLTKYTDVTISAIGGGSSVGGVVRSINTVAVSQTMGATAGTDYVYLCTDGIKLDLPSPTANTNLYTVKNISNSSILVSGTIDGDINGVIMPVKYTAVDLISSGSDWNIT